MSSYIVKAREPTVLESQPYYELAGTDLMVSFKVDTAHIVPGEIDLSCFNDALARTLSTFPVYAGRIMRPRDPTQPWNVRLTNDGVPVVVEDNDAPTEVPRDTVIQSPWKLTKGVNVLKYLDFDSDEPLMRITITRFAVTGSTSIGLSASHIIGDGFVVYQFVRLLSQNYQGLASLDPPPVYSYERTLPGSVDFSPYGKILTLDLRHLYSLRELAPYLHPERVRPVQLDIRMTCTQIKQMQASAQAELRQLDSETNFSRQDVIAGLVVYCLSHAEPKISPIQYMSTIVMNRSTPARPPNVVGNGLLWAVTEPAEDFSAETVTTIALRVRKALARSRDPKFVADYYAIHEEEMPKNANAELGQDFLQPPGYMILNSTWKFDWQSAHFGFPHKTRFYHTLLDGPRFVKIFRPNPTLLEDGSWLTRPDDAEITCFIPKEARERFKELFVQEMRKLKGTGDVEFVDS